MIIIIIGRIYASVKTSLSGSTLSLSPLSFLGASGVIFHFSFIF